MLKVNSVTVKALGDTGCEQSVILESFCRSIGLRPGGPARIVSMLNGEHAICIGTMTANVGIEGKSVQVTGLVAPGLVRDAKMILAIDAIMSRGSDSWARCAVWHRGAVRFGSRSVEE